MDRSLLDLVFGVTWNDNTKLCDLLSNESHGRLIPRR
jgi:hypothetical protein